MIYIGSQFWKNEETGSIWYEWPKGNLNHGRIEYFGPKGCLEGLKKVITAL